MAEFDVVVRGGTVDGNRYPAFRGDVGGSAMGFRDPGALLEGVPADVVVYDLAPLKRRSGWWNSQVVHAFHGGEWRRLPGSEGYHWTLVNGGIPFEQGKSAGATPGKLLRHGSAS